MKNFNFTAIDFETATSQRSSICEIGLTIVENSVITERKSWLVQPKENSYKSFNMSLHGIKPEHTQDAPTFSEVWGEVLPYLEGKTVVSHNTSFDMYALRDALQENDIAFPSFRFFCSYRLSKSIVKDCYSYSLPTLCSALGVEFKETHRADADAAACAEVFMKCLEMAEAQTIEELEEKYNFKCGEFSPETFRAQLSNAAASQSILSQITADETKVDQGSYFYGKSVCFTGAFTHGLRVDLLQMIADIGGIPTNSVTKKTDILVVGMQDYRQVGEDGISGKQKKAMDLKDAGADIEIMSETEFLSNI